MRHDSERLSRIELKLDEVRALVNGLIDMLVAGDGDDETATDLDGNVIPRSRNDGDEL